MRITGAQTKGKRHSDDEVPSNVETVRFKGMLKKADEKLLEHRRAKSWKLIVPSPP